MQKISAMFLWNFRRGFLIMSLLTTLGCSLQERLLYYPESRVPTDKELAQHGMAFWPEAANYRGFIGKMPEGKSRGTVIVLHGNAATAADRIYYLDPLRRLGYRVILVEYPGYGARKGKLGEKSFVTDVRETIRKAKEQYGGPTLVVGESLGCAVAASAVREPGAGVDGLVLVTPWDSLEKVASEHYPALIVRMFLTDRFDTVANLKEFNGPVAVLAAERDTIIPPHHAQELYHSFSGRKRIWNIRGVGHNDWPDVVGDNLWKEIVSFVDSSGPS